MTARTSWSNIWASRYHDATCIGMLPGACISSVLDTNPGWKAAYDVGISQLLKRIIYPTGLARSILVLLVLSGSNVHTMSTIPIKLTNHISWREYDCNLFGGIFSPTIRTPCAKVPRVIWPFLVFARVLALGITSHNKLLDVLENFLSLLGYWNTSFAILFIEHYYFRKGSLANYDLDAWNDSSRTPVGYAGLAAFLCGAAGWIVGMVETYYVGALAKMIG